MPDINTVVVTPSVSVVQVNSSVPGSYDSVARLGLGWLNVKDPLFGAVGDGVADDTAAIQACFNALPTAATAANVYTNRGGVVLIPAGTYRLTATITIPRGCVILGAGSESTLLQPEQTSGDVLYYERPDAAMSTLPPIKMSGFRIIVKSGVTHTGGAGIHIDSADTTPSKGGRFEGDDLYVYGTYEGYRLRNIQGGFLRYSEAHYCGSSGVVLRGFQTLFAVTGCWSSGNTGHGWDISGAAYCHFSASGSDSNTLDGWHVERQSGDGAMYGNTFASLGSEGNRQDLFSFNNVAMTEFTGFGLGASSAAYTRDAIRLTAIQTMRIAVWIGSDANSTGYGIRVTDPATSVNITLDGAVIPTYLSGKATGMECVSIRNQQSAAGVGAINTFGGQTTATNFGGNGALNVNRRTAAAGTAGRILSDLRSIASDNQGTAYSQISADNGNSFARVEHNSTIGGPYTFGTFGDVIYRATNTFFASSFRWVINATERMTLSAVGFLTTSRFIGNGTSHVAGDYAASANWGTTPTITPLARDTGGRVSILAQATTGANPTLALTFKDGTWTTAPAISYGRGDTAAPTTCFWALTTITATVATWTFVGTPTAGNTYVLDFTVTGK